MDGKTTQAGDGRITQPLLPDEATLLGDEDPSTGPRRRRGSPTLERGRAIGRYLIVERLGAGGMGVVLRAFDPDLDRSVAIKLVGVESAGGEHDTLQVRERLLREAQAMARLSHPNVIAVYDVGLCDADGGPIDDPAEASLVYVAMEYVDGVTLRQWSDGQTRPWAQVRECYAAAGRGLAAAHAAGLIHRDFKPDNVMVGDDGRVRVLDFGLARALGKTPTVRDAELADLRSGQLESLDRSMTAAGAVMGTPAYMSPEQHLGAPTDDKSDQFSFCVAMFEALYGKRPFRGDTLAALSLHVMQGKIEIPDDAPSVPGFVHRALVRGLEVDADKRFVSMDALLRALYADPAKRRRRWWQVGAIVGVLGLGAGIGARLSGSGADPTTPPEPCTGAADAFAKVWNDARRTTVGDAFSRSQRAYAADTWARAATAIDAQAQAWIDEHTAACRATRVTGEQSEAKMDERIGCLVDQRDRLDALLGAMTRADDDSVARAIDAVRSLPPPDRCRSPPDAGAAPSDPDRARWAAAVEAALPPIRAAIDLGRFDEARAALAPWVAPTDALDHPPVTAAVRSLQAELADAPKLERDLLEGSLWAATAAGDSQRALGLTTRLAIAVGYRLADRDGGERWLAFGRALLRRRGDDPDARAHLDGAEGTILVAAGQYADALVAHGRARDHWAQDERAATRLANVLLDMGAAHVALGNVDEAIALDKEALRLRRTVYGDEHPVIAAALRELGNAIGHTPDTDAALPKLQEALTIRRATNGADSTDVAILLDDIGRMLRRKGDLQGAIEHHEQALKIWEAKLGDPHADLAVSLLNIGYTFAAAGRHDEALTHQQRALQMFEAALGPEHPYIVYASNSVGASLVRLARFEEARPVLRRALTLTHVSVDPTLFAETKFTLANALADDPAATRAERVESVQLAKAARDSYATQAQRWGPQIEQIDAWLAERS